MSTPEQADYSAERTTQPTVTEQLLAEHSRAGSTLNLIRQLGEGYRRDKAHAPSMLQLQRMAGMVTNPTNEETYPASLTNAFYWGEILAYRAQDILSDGDWDKNAYPMLSGAMIEQYEDARLFFEDLDLDTGERLEPARSHSEELHAIGAMIMGNLEEPEIEFMPPAMEELIIRLTDELAEDSEERWYIILGFRHVTMEVVQMSLSDALRKEERAAETKEREEAESVKKRADRDKKILGKQFMKLVGKKGIDEVRAPEPLPVDSIREHIMESYADHMISYHSYDATDEDDMEMVREYLNNVMNRDFNSLEEIEIDDFLEVSGSAIFILYDGQSASQTMYMLGKNELLKGSADGVGIVETPSLQTMLRLQEHVIEADEVNEDINPLGVVMILKEPVLVNSDGSHIQLGGGVVAGLVMANPHMHIAKHPL